MKSSVAKRIKNGTILEKEESLVWVRSIAPASPPTTLTTKNLASHERMAPRCSRYPNMLPAVPRTSASVLVAFAISEPVPRRINVGKVTSVPPPATAFIEPATIAAAASSRIWTTVTRG